MPAVRSAAGPRANTFFALTPPPQARDAIATVQQRLAQALPSGVRCVPPSGFHITLSFLGALSAGALDALRGIASGCSLPPVRIDLDQPGVFPAARVGWLGCAAVDPALIAFRDELVDALRGGGFRTDGRPWVPHLTLYRKLRTDLPRLRFKPVGWVCDGFELLRTEPGLAGPVYRVVGHWNATPQADGRGEA